MIFKYPKDNEIIQQKLKKRKALYEDQTMNQVKEIFNQVLERGNSAVCEFTSLYDKADIQNIELTEDFINDCVNSISDDLRKAIDHAITNISEVNQALMPEKRWLKEIRKGTVIGEQISPLESVGLWVPARKAPLISAALMLIVAAKVAGVKRIVVGMPPALDGKPNKATVAAAKIAGANEIIIGNGVAVIGAFTHGTETFKDVQAIYGPGPGAIAASMALSFTYGKRTVVGIGPTDSAIMADDGANIDYLQKDIFNEAEHGFDSSSVLVTTSESLASKLEMKVKEALQTELQRKDILNHVFSEKGMGIIVLAEDYNEACKFVNDYAPEHLMLYVDESIQDELLGKIENAGEILIGEYTPFTAGNYAIGITAVLPTNGFAKSCSGVTCKDMIKVTTIGKLSKEALKTLYPTIKELGVNESLPNHLNAVKVRVES